RLCVCRERHCWRRPGSEHGSSPPGLEETLGPVHGDPQRNPGDPQSRAARGDRCPAQAHDAVIALWHSNRHRDDRLLRLDGDARMNHNNCLGAVTRLLSFRWKAGLADQTLPSAGGKLQRPCRLFRRNRRAAAAVEFAIVAPVFFLLVFGMIEYGRMVMVYQILTNASREGARVAVLDGATESGVTTQVNNYTTDGGITG